MGTPRSAMAHDVHGALGAPFEVSAQHLRWVHILAGPALFFVSLALPLLGPLSARFGFGILLWMIYWWVSVPVDIKATCLVPILVAAAYPFMPLDKVVASYADKEMLLIIGMSMMTAAWARWGFARRIGLHFLSLVGNNVQAQTVAWFWLCGVVSFVVANTPVGAIFAPVAVAALLYAGYQSLELVEAWVERPDGERIQVTEDGVFTRMSEAAQTAPGFVNSRTTTVVFPQLTVGSKTHVAWRFTDGSTGLGFNHVYQPDFSVPLEVADITLNVPATAAIAWRTRGPFEVKERTAGVTKTIHARLEGFEGLAREPGMVAPEEVLPAFVATSLRSWEEIGRRFREACRQC